MNVKSDLVREVSSVAKVAPQWAAIVLVVSGFIWYLRDKGIQEDAVSAQRIAICHDVQSGSTEAIKELTKVLSEQEQALEVLSDSCDRMSALLQQILDRE